MVRKPDRGRLERAQVQLGQTPVPSEQLAGAAPADDVAPSLARSGVLLGVANAVANAMGYAVTLVLASALSPSDFGALGALFGVALIAAVPGNALQLVVGRATARDTHTRTTTAARAGVRLALAIGLALTAFLAVLTPVLVDFLHLPDGAPVLWLAAMLVPYTLTAGVQGVLLGHARFQRLAWANVITAAARLAAGVLAATLGWGLAGVMAAITVAATVALAIVSILARDLFGARASRDSMLGETVVASLGVAGLIGLSSSDVLLARHFLPPDVSGAYVLAALFAKAGLWGTQFVVMLFYPRLADAEQRRAALLRSVLLICLLGALLVLAAVLLAGPMVHALSGSRYDQASDTAWMFAVLGTMWALVQLMVLSGVAQADRGAWALLWAGVALQVVLIATVAHDGITDILAACLLTAALLVATGWARESSRNRRVRAARPA